MLKRSPRSADTDGILRKFDLVDQKDDIGVSEIGIAVAKPGTERQPELPNHLGRDLAFRDPKLTLNTIDLGRQSAFATALMGDALDDHWVVG